MPDYPKANLKAWIKAMRLRTLPLAASSSIAGSALAWNQSSNWSGVFILALITTLLLQILSNLANDYGDFSKGLDNANRVGPRRALQSGEITKQTMQKALLLFVLLSLVSGILLLYVSFAAEQMFGKMLLFFTLGIGAIIASLRYTIGINPYGYRGLGDVSVFLFFGLLGVCGTYFLHTKHFELLTILPAVTIGLLSVAVLNLNNLRDHQNDRAGGKKTVVVRIGFEKGKKYHFFLLLTAILSSTAWIFFVEGLSLKLVIILPLIYLIPHIMRVFRCQFPAVLDPELKKVAFTTFVFALLLLLVHCSGDFFY